MKYTITYLFIILFIGISFLLLPVKIKTESNINTNQTSLYDAKNENSKTNEINITKNNQNEETKKKYVALTFDDGPSIYTKNIIDLLKQYNYNATFFVLGNNLNIDKKDILIESINNGNELGVHGYSHQSFTRMTKEQLEEEITKTKKYIHNMTGYIPTLVRPPYGNINDKIRSYNYGPYILWNNDTKDWKYKDAKKIYNRVISTIKDNNIILMHDTYLTTYKALELILPYLKENNYEVVTVSKLFEIANISLKQNKSYRNV